MEKWIKILESNFQLFQTNDDLITFISILRLCDTDGLLDSTMSRLITLSRLTEVQVKQSLNHLYSQGLISVNPNGDNILCKVNVKLSSWTNGQKKPNTQQEELSEMELKFRERLKLKFDRIAGMARPLLLSEYNEISTIYSREQILEVMLAMQNFADLNRKYTSAKLTLLNWLKRRYG